MVKQQEEKMLQLIDKSGEVTVCDGDLAELHAWGGAGCRTPLSISSPPRRG